MQRPSKPQKRKKGRDLATPAPMSLKDKLQIWSWIGGVFLIVAAMLYLYTTTQSARHLDQTINRWRKDYHLSPEQAERVRSIERSFHGSGNPFTLPSHTAEEVRVHHQEVAAAMSPADGERFLTAQEKGKTHR